MDIDGNRAWRSLGVLAALCMVVALGELRAQGSDTVASTASFAGMLAGLAPTAEAAAFDPAAATPLRADDDGPSTPASHAGQTDDAHLVPAIYAWDPDVRFIYFRHVSKWM